MSLANPTAVAPLVPAAFTLSVAGHACGVTDRSTVPDTMLVPVDAAAALAPLALPPGHHAGAVGFRDTLSAVYNRAASAGNPDALIPIPPGTDPDNLPRLAALGAQLALDYCSWSLPRFDVSYHGIIGVEPDPLLDGIEFGYDGESGCWTRWWSAPFGDQATEFNHADPADCPECLIVYGPPTPARVLHPDPKPDNTVETKSQLTRWKWCLERGRAVLKAAGVDVFNGCCGGCSTTILIQFLPLAGTKPNPWLCGPGTINYTIAGKTTAGKAINLAGSITPASRGGNNDYATGLTFPSTQLPEGNYSIHLFEFTVNACSAPTHMPGPTGRFDGTFSFTVECPKTTVTCVLQAQFDVISASSNFGLAGCQVPYGAVNLAVSATISGGSECYRQLVPWTRGGTGGNIFLVCKVTSYPFTVSFAGSGNDCLPGSETLTWTGCTQGPTSDMNSSPVVYYKKYPMSVWGCNVCGSPVPLGTPGATVTASGGITGTGTTDNSGAGLMELTEYVQDKVGVTDDQKVIFWTIRRDRFVGASYNSRDYYANLSKNNVGPLGGYPATLCPIGGSVGLPAPGYACGGCPVPLKTSLHATVLGESVGLQWNGGAWVGQFTHNMAALSCDFQPMRTTGDVQFALGFSCLGTQAGSREFRPLFELLYAVDATGNPTLCHRNDPFTNGTGGWQTPVGVASYGSRVSASCQPFLGTLDFEWGFGVSRRDGSGIDDPFLVNVSITISE